MDIQQWCLKVFTVILEQPALKNKNKKPWIQGWSVFIYTFGGRWNSLIPVECLQNAHACVLIKFQVHELLKSTRAVPLGIHGPQFYALKFIFMERYPRYIKWKKIEDSIYCMISFSIKCYIYMSTWCLRGVGSSKRIVFTFSFIDFILKYIV